MASVLVIHNRSDICHLLSKAIESRGHKCHSLVSCEDATLIIKTTDFDIILLDIDITEKPYEAVRAFVESKCRPNVLIITSDSDPGTLKQSIRAGAWDVLCAPFTSDKLDQAIDRCLHQRRSRMDVKNHTNIKRTAIIGNSICLEQCLNQVASVAHSNVNVLILGDTGTGKELFANAIHENSNRVGKNFIVVDCNNIPKNQVMSLPSDHEPDFSSEASASWNDLFRQAAGGTLFLDEIGDLDIDTQKSLRRLVQKRPSCSLGSKDVLTKDVRLVAATNHNLESMVKRGKFREELYHRLRTCVIQIPPLRDRTEDIRPIANYHIPQICAELGYDVKELSDEIYHALTLYDWPGNVRELINVLHATVQNGPGEYRLYPQHLPVDIRAKVILKRSRRPQNAGYLVIEEATEGMVENKTVGCPLLPPSQDDASSSPSANYAPVATPQVPPAPQQIVGPPTEHPLGNCCEMFETPYIALPLYLESSEDSQLRSLRAVRELAMQNVETAYMQILVSNCQGNFKRALAISGLSRARLYDLLSKHKISISGN